MTQIGEGYNTRQDIYLIHKAKCLCITWEKKIMTPCSNNKMRYILPHDWEKHGRIKGKIEAHLESCHPQLKWHVAVHFRSQLLSHIACLRIVYAAIVSTKIPYTWNLGASICPHIHFRCKNLLSWIQLHFKVKLQNQNKAIEIAWLENKH